MARTCFGCGEPISRLVAFTYVHDPLKDALGDPRLIRGPLYPESGEPFHMKCARAYQKAKDIYDPETQEPAWHSSIDEVVGQFRRLKELIFPDFSWAHQIDEHIDELENEAR